ncbi:hypothetical protein [Rhodococcus sp. ACPA1]|uniref:hypothetical protein n=1 Tax=Rhodococcus sp. ACPA1 TaxID=2028572 RepID=UPI000BB0F1CF|nr:hypothetical protein [Rhodococcus sp. ACPA1]PBC57963.1 hypothetical protein CJ177_09000 [Rhodococcus sp. ACPA1]
MVYRCTEKLATQLDPTPEWFPGFGEFLATRAAPTRAISLLHQLAAILTASPGAGPTAILRAARLPGPAVGALARALETYFVDSRLTLTLDVAGQAAAERRARRVAEVPYGFRPIAAAFDRNQLQSRERARRAGTNPAPTAHSRSTWPPCAIWRATWSRTAPGSPIRRWSVSAM